MVVWAQGRVFTAITFLEMWKAISLTLVGERSLMGKGSSDSLKESDSSDNSLGLTLATCINIVCHLWGGQRALSIWRGTYKWITLSGAAPASRHLWPKLSMSPACGQALKLLCQQLEMAGPWVSFKASEYLQIPNVAPKSGHENKAIYCTLVADILQLQILWRLRIWCFACRKDRLSLKIFTKLPGND